jgi:signal transduction histidine kinase
MTLASRIDRARILVGGTSGLSNPVIIGFAIEGFVITFMFGRGLLQAPWLPTLAVAACSLAASCGFLLVMRRVAVRLGWERPRLGLVVGSLVAASVIRPLVNVAMFSGLPTAGNAGAESSGRVTAAVVVSVAVSIGLAAVVQLGRERGALTASLLADQSRLLALAETMEQDIVRADAELRVKASQLLEPTIAEVRGLLDGELSEAEAARIAERIRQSVNDVVRPVSKELAVAPSMAIAELEPMEPARLDLLSDRMDVPAAMRPGWVSALSWFIILAPVLLLLGLGVSAWITVLAATLVFYAAMVALRAAWPQSLRSMRIASGLAALFVVYLVGNFAIYAVIRHSGTFAGASAWALTPPTILIRVAFAMIIVVLAMLDDHGQRTRASLAELNVELGELVARLRRETWLLHRSVALAVHGPVQSALVSTAMRLAAAHRTKGSVDDAKRRLDEALSAIEQNRYEDVSIDDALGDLRDLWRGVVRIDFAIDHGSRALLDADPGLRRCVIEVCRESASNAIRHGGAGAVVISMTDDGGRVEVRVRDDGRGVDPGAVAGLGSSMLDDTCLRWELCDVSGGGAELVATLV